MLIKENYLQHIRRSYYSLEMPRLPKRIHLYEWEKPQTLKSVRYTCGYCGHLVSSEKGWMLYSIIRDSGEHLQHDGVFICPDCKCPTFVYPNEDYRVPDAAFGSEVDNLPDGLKALYDEARNCTANGSYTGAVLLLRKMLMNIAVDQGAEEGLNFFIYVNYLSDNHYIPPNGKGWVDHIRRKGNEATHEIALMNRSDSENLIVFIEMLLRFIYEFPNSIPKSDETPN